MFLKYFFLSTINLSPFLHRFKTGKNSDVVGFKKKIEKKKKFFLNLQRIQIPQPFEFERLITI